MTALAYLLVLFLIASRGERSRQEGARPWRYTLALGVHCTTWAFYGTVTQSAHYGWAFAPTYIGAIVIFLFAHGLLMRTLHIVREHNLTSIADLMGARYARSHGISAFVAIISLVALVPYIALQLRAVTSSFSAVTGLDATRIPWFNDLSAGVAIAMIGFSILFGARRLTLAEKHSGLMDVVAFESIVKLLAFAIVGIFCSYVLFEDIGDLVVQAAQNPLAQEVLTGKPNGGYVFVVHMVLGAVSMFVLPRQFHVNFVENIHPKELKTARWGFPLYLFAINFFILPIALAGLLLVPDLRTQDTFMLALPVLAERPDISLIAFIGGLSAAVSMVIMATLSLSIMISNDVITPLFLKSRAHKDAALALTPHRVLTIRRLTMVLIIALAYFYHLATQSGVPLVSNGLIAMALLAQLAPGLIGGVIWSKGHRWGVVSGLTAGTCIWVYGLLLPSFRAVNNDQYLLTDVQMSHWIVLALGLNVLLYMVVSIVLRSSSAERESAEQFIHADTYHSAIERDEVTWGRLRSVLARFIDQSDASRLDQRLGIAVGAAPGDGVVPHSVLTRIEREMAGAIGSAASRLVIDALARQSQVSVDEVVNWASEASELYRFNRELLQASVENIPQGISVIDNELRLVAWNRRYIEIFDYPEGFIQAGMPVLDILKYNADRGMFGQPSDNIETEVEKRLNYLRSGSSYRYQRAQSDGRVIELQGSPMPDGGFVTTYTDVSNLVRAQEELRHINAELEARVAERTQQLLEAKQAAEQAHSSKSRFFAAASHDLMQPFNAATLFCEMLEKRSAGESLQLARQIQRSLENAEELLTMLLEMTKLDSGTLKPDIQEVPLIDIFQPLVDSFRVLAEEKGLDLNVHGTSAIVRTDRKLLRRVLQNLLSNAIRYTEKGRVVLGVRRRHDGLDLMVCDSGRGIPEEQQTAIFDEFHQLDQQEQNPGLGLGLAIVERMCRLLEVPLHLRSEVGRGTCFSVRIPVVRWEKHGANIAEPKAIEPALLLTGKKVLVVDNDQAVRTALSSLLEDWGAVVTSCHSPEEADRLEQAPELMLIDYHLDDGRVGVEVIEAVRRRFNKDIPAIVNTADPNEGVREEVVRAKAQFLPKPVKQAALKRLIKRLGI
ncbi:PAS domain-containing hybrid sensor histidine kinase/response regulator [Lysobacter sp. N42]|uniref:PAS domain-containing hybrid sensor histidine kinase/response regulator n=1 Tax=Lysobacter sp. N42 TaxID=2545719 RepID=UPI001A9CBC83|nr:PAS domain-containing hybrid sensor histidine kinase/response regulator [Lysobacter sp. N42]